MGFTIHSGSGGPNALINPFDETDPRRQASLRLSWGLRVRRVDAEIADPSPANWIPSGARSDDTNAGAFDVQHDVHSGAANCLAGTVTIGELESAARLAGLGNEVDVEPAVYPGPGNAVSMSVYDLAPLSSYAALKIG